MDFEQPRALWSKVWNDQQREAYVRNVAGHFGKVKSPLVKARQRKFSISNKDSVTHTDENSTVSVWAAVDQGLSDRIAQAVGHPSVPPLAVKPAAEAVRFRANIGLSAQRL